MTLEQSITEAVSRAITPLVDSNRKLAAEVEQLRRALPPQLVSIRDAAKALGLGVRTVQRRIADGSLPVRRDGRTIRVDLSAATRPAPESDVLKLVSDLRSR